MDSLLRGNERRLLKMTEYLFEKDDWITIAELSKALNTSTRMLKYDFDMIKESIDDFTILTSNKGVKLEFYKNRGIKTLYKNVLERSLSFQLLELLLLNENYTTFEIADKLFISLSTLYRMIDQINEVTKKYDFQIETNPCRLTGDENSIRLFYYSYIFEKYTDLDWAVFTSNLNLDIAIIDSLIYFFVNLVNVELDFANYNILKLFIVVNFIRYQNGHFSKINSDAINIHAILKDIQLNKDALDYFAKQLKTKIDIHFVTQIFSPFIYDGYSLDYDRLLEKAQNNKKIKREMNYIEKFIIKLATNNNLVIPNIEDIIYSLHNSTLLEDYDPRGNYILYDRNAHFMYTVEEEFPFFYEQLYEEIKNYRHFLGLKESEKSIHYLMYIVFSKWNHLVLELRKRYDQIKILVISNRNSSHSYMLKDFIEYEFGSQLKIDIYDGSFLTKEILEELEYDFIIANFPLPALNSKNCLCIENIPTYNDLTKIQREIDEIVLKRNKERTAKSDL